MVARAHGDAPYAEAALAGKTLAACSSLPGKVAENLGAGFGQWDFFPSAAEIVDFALRYASPSSPEDVWALARAWASDDASRRPTPLALVGREILQKELARFELPALRAAVGAWRASLDATVAAMAEWQSLAELTLFVRRLLEEQERIDHDLKTLDTGGGRTAPAPGGR